MCWGTWSAPRPSGCRATAGARMSPHTSNPRTTGVRSVTAGCSRTSGSAPTTSREVASAFRGCTMCGRQRRDGRPTYRAIPAPGPRAWRPEPSYAGPASRGRSWRRLIRFYSTITLCTNAGIRCTSGQPHRWTISHRPGRLTEARWSAALRAPLKRDMQRGHQPPREHAERRPTAKRRRPWP